MKTSFIFKDSFSVIGKRGQGPSSEPGKWIGPLWEEFNMHFSEITDVIKHNEEGAIFGLWGAMNDVDEKNKRWGESGKYMAGCEADINSVAPEGWTKWTIPDQTYLVAECTMDTYGEVFGALTNDSRFQIVGTVHERYPESGNPNKIELYFPIASGMLFCQSCAMPMVKEEEFGTKKDGDKSMDYCCYCYRDGEFTEEMTMEEMIEHCIPFCLEHYENEDAARADMQNIFRNMKRWVRTE